VIPTPFEPAKGGRRARVLVVEQPGEGIWGAQRYLLRLAPLLEARGYDQVLAAPESSAVARAWRQQGRPHVHFPVSPERKIRRHGDRGPLSPLLLARQDDVAHLSACIGRVLTDADLRAHLARAARAQVVTTFTLEQQADRQARLLDDLVGGRGDRRPRTRSAIQREFTA
jgi:hypothetical protein